MNTFKMILLAVAMTVLAGCNSGSGSGSGPAPVAASPVTQVPVAQPSTNVPSPGPSPVQPPERGPIAPPPVGRPRNPHSNAPEGFLDEADGYALWYPIGGNGQPVGMPWYWYDHRTWQTVAEIDAYKVAVIQSYANRAAEDASFADFNFDGPIPVASLTPDEKFFLLSVARRTGPPDVFYKVCSGKAIAIADAINWAEANDDENVDYFGQYPVDGRLRAHV